MRLFKCKIAALLHQEGSSCDVEKFTERALVLEHQGADYIDMGGAKALLGLASVSVQEERECVLPILRDLKAHLRIPISLEVSHVEVAKEALLLGVAVICDLSGFRDPAMRKLAAKARADVCIVHHPEQGAFHKVGIVEDTIDWLDKQVRLLLHEGVEQSRIIIDPGIGVGKTEQENLEILRHIQKLRALGFRIAVGIDHKSLIANTERVLPVLIALNTFLMLSHVDIIRVHDVQAHRDAFNHLYQVALDF